MKANEFLQQQIPDMADHQSRSNDPHESKLTLDRLIKPGDTEEDSKKLIGQCVAVEITEVLYSQKPFDEKRCVMNLANLPKPPFDENKQNA